MISLGLRQPEYGHAAAVLGHQARPFAAVPHLHGQKRRALLPSIVSAFCRLGYRIIVRRVWRRRRRWSCCGAELERGHDSGYFSVPCRVDGMKLLTEEAVNEQM